MKRMLSPRAANEEFQPNSEDSPARKRARRVSAQSDSDDDAVCLGHVYDANGGASVTSSASATATVERETEAVSLQQDQTEQRSNTTDPVSDASNAESEVVFLSATHPPDSAIEVNEDELALCDEEGSDTEQGGASSVLGQSIGLPQCCGAAIVEATPRIASTVPVRQRAQSKRRRPIELSHVENFAVILADHDVADAWRRALGQSQQAQREDTEIWTNFLSDPRVPSSAWSRHRVQFRERIDWPCIRNATALIRVPLPLQQQRKTESNIYTLSLCLCHSYLPRI